MSGKVEQRGLQKVGEGKQRRICREIGVMERMGTMHRVDSAVSIKEDESGRKRLVMLHDSFRLSSCGRCG